LEKDTTCKEEEFSKVTDLMVDFLELDLGKKVVDGKLGEEFLI